MTSAIEFPLRPYTQDWPGVNSTGGKTMRAGGEMSDCTNVQINRGDTLAKRQGFVRALDEQFSGVVCGLFVYADDCGREFLLVADEEQISIRTPFQLREIQTLDCYPHDGFDEDSLDTELWRNTDRYVGSLSQMRLGSALQESSLAEGIENATRWFKEACSTSYSVNAQFSFDASAASRILVVLRGNGDLGSGQLIAGELRHSGTSYVLRVVRRTSNLQEIEIGRIDFTSTVLTGFFDLAYDATTRRVTATITISGANQELISDQLDAVVDANLGLVSAIGIGQTGPSFPSTTGILQVTGQSV